MNMSIKINKIRYRITTFLLIVYLIDYHFFYLLKYPNKISQYFAGANMILLIALFGIIYYFILIYCHHKIIYKYKYLNVYVWIIFYLIILMVFYASLVYPMQSLADTLRLASRFIWIFLAFPILILFSYSDKGEKDFFNLLTKLSLIWLVILFLQSVIYKYNGHTILDLSSYFSSQTIQVRSHGIRIGLQSLGNYLLIYNFDIVYNQKTRLQSKILSLIYVALGLYCLIFVQQTRAFTFVVFLCISLAVLFGSGNALKKINNIVVIAVAVVALTNSNTLSTFLSSFSINGVEANNTISRINGITYYWNGFLANPIFSHGFAFEKYYPGIVHGNAYLFYLDDDGVFGLLSQIGIFIIIIYILPILRMIYIAIKYIKKKLADDWCTMFVTIIFLISTSLSLIITDSQRILLWPILIAYFEYKNYVLKEK